MAAAAAAAVVYSWWWWRCLWQQQPRQLVVAVACGSKQPRTPPSTQANPHLRTGSAPGFRHGAIVSPDLAPGGWSWVAVVVEEEEAVVAMVWRVAVLNLVETLHIKGVEGEGAGQRRARVGCAITRGW